MNTLSTLEPQGIWSQFSEILQVPRPSKFYTHFGMYEHYQCQILSEDANHCLHSSGY